MCLTFFIKHENLRMRKINLHIRKFEPNAQATGTISTLASCHSKRMKQPALQPAPNEPHSLDRVTFGGRIRAARKRFGWTLQDLANASGVSITTISRAERGLLALGYENLSALAHALHLDKGSTPHFVVGAVGQHAHGADRSTLVA